MIKGYLGNVCYEKSLLKNHVILINEEGDIKDILPFSQECEGIILCDNLIIIAKCNKDDIESITEIIQEEFDKSKSYNDFLDSAIYKRHAASSKENAHIIEIEIKEDKAYDDYKTESIQYNNVTKSKSYKLVCILAKVMDRYYIDPIIGIIPVAGDIVPPLCSIPSIYISVIKLKSIPLTFAIILNILIDALIGVIPFFIGNILDFYNKAYIKNLNLIIGYINNDKQVIKEVNKKAIISASLILGVTLLLIAATIFTSKFVVFLWEYLNGLFKL